MKYNIIAAFTTLLITLVTQLSVFAKTETYTVTAKDKEVGYCSRKITLSSYQVPDVKVTSVQYSDNVALPAHFTAGNSLTPLVKIGIDRKVPFAVIQIPLYSNGDLRGTYKMVQSFTLEITEPTTTEARTAEKQTADVTNSALATGTWYKIAVTQTGFYKLDYSFFVAAGIKPADLVAGNLRVLGNGGAMLSENNAVPRITDLRENAIWVNDGGDNVINDADYALFYAKGPTGWEPDLINKRFYHLKNLYTDTAYYFISFNSGTGLRVQQQTSVPTPNTTSTGFNYYDVHERDLVNPTGYGKTWYGESFSGGAGTTQQSFNFDLGDVTTDLVCKFSLACMQEKQRGSSFQVSVNGATIGTANFWGITGGSLLTTHLRPTWNVPFNNRLLTATLNFVPTATSTGYLDYIEINGRRGLRITSSQLSFRDMLTTGADKVVSYSLEGANNFTKVWDVTDPQVPVMMNGSLSGSTYTFVQDAATLHEFAAINNNGVNTPKMIGAVPNQNLHGSPQVDYIIVTHPAFKQAAEKLADFHRQKDNLRTIVATPAEIYNEFSSGGQDISAIRDFARMFYKRAGTDSSQMPKYLLLLGGASYDYKDRLPNNSNFVPTFETANDSNDIYAFLSDDFFAFLDDNEHIENYNIINTLDIGVGRLPARSVADANIVVDKCINYKGKETLGPWRLSAMFVSDDNDGAGDHLDDAEVMTRVLSTVGNNDYNFQKVYLNAITPVSTPAGTRSPNASAAINEQIYKGTFLVNYNGHGNPEVWAGERILTQDDFNQWSNANMLPIMVTATCDFGQYDHPQYVSAAEQLLLRNGGGAIAMVTTTGAVYATFNTPMNADYLTAQFTKNPDGSWNTFGEACRRGKNSSYRSDLNQDRTANYRKFALLADPALIPNFPVQNIKIDSIIDGTLQVPTDSIKALGKYHIQGSIRDNNKDIITSFNGTVYISIYDKARDISITAYDGTRRTFQMQDNLIYKGKVSVTNGLFALTFIAPKDINYYYGKGKISSYAENGVYDAAGADTSTIIGGFSNNPITSDVAPVVLPYINDSMFINGGITGANTSLFVILKSETGINVSGYGLGHNLTATLDGDHETAYNLNDYYETAPNTYQRGYVKFPLIGLADGKHSMTIKAWDVNNNSGTGTVDFVVVNGEIVDIRNLGNYPNPFSNATRFVFEHNHPDELMDVKINIYNAAGSLARSLSQTFTPSGSRTAEITWDGTDNSGAPLPSGIYVYKLNIQTDKGYNTTAYQKLVIVR